MSRFQKWALATTIATYLLIMVGGLVRASGAGLGCPDWPKCFGRYYPPLHESEIPANAGIDPALFDVQLAWTEYINRMIGVTIGFLIIITLFYAIKDHRHNKRILYSTGGVFVLTLFQGWLGGQVVTSELAPWLVTTHMVLALIIVSLLLYATVEAFYPDSKDRSTIPIQRRRLGTLAIVVLLVTLVQVGLGAKLRGDLENVQEDNPVLARSDWIDETGWSDVAHRTYSWLILIGTGGIVYYTHRRMAPNKWFRNMARVMMGMVLLQIVAGIGLAYGGLPPALQVVHLINASVLVGTMTLMYLLTNRLPERDQPPVESSHAQPRLSQNLA